MCRITSMTVKMWLTWPPGCRVLSPQVTLALQKVLARRSRSKSLSQNPSDLRFHHLIYTGICLKCALMSSIVSLNFSCASIAKGKWLFYLTHIFASLALHSASKNAWNMWMFFIWALGYKKKKVHVIITKKTGVWHTECKFHFTLSIIENLQLTTCSQRLYRSFQEMFFSLYRES